MTKPKNESQRGEKRRYIREAIESLGLDAKYTDAAKWVKNRYGTQVSDPTFYHIRKEMQEEAQRGPSSEGADQSAAEAGEPTSAGASASQTQTTPQLSVHAGTAPAAPRANVKPTGSTEQEAGGGAQAQQGVGEVEDGVAALVLKAKSLVARLGKEEAKRLIDAL